MSELRLQKFSFPQGDYYFEQPWTLNGVTYLFTFRYNDRASIWFMDIADATATPIVSGVALRASRDLLAAYRTKGNLPQGTFAVYDANGNARDPGPDSFSTTHSLLYGYKA